VEVFEISLFLATIFDSPRQTTAILTHLIPVLYPSFSTPLRNLTTLLSLIHHLVAAYPSQVPFHQHLRSLPPSVLHQNSESIVWITSLASSLRSLNYSKFEALTRISSFSHFFMVPHELQSKTAPAEVSVSTSETPGYSCSGVNLANRALQTLVESLRSKAREKTWHVIRSAYRELACHPGFEATRGWLERSLALSAIVPTDTRTDVDDWLEIKSLEGHVRKKEGASEGRWIICKGQGREVETTYHGHINL